MRVMTDEALRQRHGSVLNSTYALRNRYDAPAPERCPTCSEIMFTEGDEAMHQMAHSHAGRLVAYASVGRMQVYFATPETFESQVAMAARFGRESRLVRLDASKVDWRSNGPRAVCTDCGGYSYLSGRGWQHNHQDDHDHIPTIALHEENR